MNIYCYDIECYPNFFSVTFVNTEVKEDKEVFCITEGRNDCDGLVSFLDKQITLVGYNCHSYDDPMLRYIQSYDGFSLNKDLFSLSKRLIAEDSRDDKGLISLRYPKNGAFKWKSIDLMRILAFDVLGVSLKQTAINLKWHKIQDLPIPFDSKINKDDIDLILEYNENDVLITKKLYERIAPLRKLREELSAIYGVDVSSASNSRMANLIFDNIYSKELNIDIKQIRNKRTERPHLKLSDCIAKFVEFETPELQDLLQRIRSMVVYQYNNYKYAETLFFAGLEFSIGVGGLHTNDSPKNFSSDENYLIQDMDVSSYYPNLIINNNFYPKHLGESFIRILRKITKERIEAKKSGDKVKADGLKITVNSIFGKLGSDTYWLKDPKQLLSTTVSGQMGLLMLVEGLYLKGIDVISCNTDGVVCNIDRNKIEEYYEVAKEWERKTGLELEFTPYKKYIRRDVNNYITEKEDGHTKEKGIFIKDIDLSKGYRMPIVPIAIYEYFINGIPVRNTIEASKDIMDFCISQKSASNFGIELHTIHGIEKLQKTNRFFISTAGGNLVKRDRGKNNLIGQYVGKLVSILNDYDESIPFEKYHVDLSFYEKEVMKIIDEIEPKQMTLFEVTSSDRGSLGRMDFKKTSDTVEIKKELSINEMNKLGKNQIMSHIETIVSAGKDIKELNTRYVYTLDFNQRSLIADFYILGTGKKHTIKIDKDNYKKMYPLKKGDLIFCNKFIKNKEEEWVLFDYTITDNFGITGISIM